MVRLCIALDSERAEPPQVTSRSPTGQRPRLKAPMTRVSSDSATSSGSTGRAASGRCALVAPYRCLRRGHCCLSRSNLGSVLTTHDRGGQPRCRHGERPIRLPASGNSRTRAGSRTGRPLAAMPRADGDAILSVPDLSKRWRSWGPAAGIQFQRPPEGGAERQPEAGRCTDEHRATLGPALPGRHLPAGKAGRGQARPDLRSRVPAATGGQGRERAAGQRRSLTPGGRHTIG